MEFLVSMDAAAVHTTLMSLPLHPWPDINVQALATHPVEGTAAAS